VSNDRKLLDAKGIRQVDGVLSEGDTSRKARGTFIEEARGE
jgi:hypothetical protein